MVKPIFIANWKMNLTLKERVALAQQIKDDWGKNTDKEIVICPPFISLVQLAEIFKNSHIKLGAQDVFWEETGAYTGEISPLILKEIDCQYVIIGHSERRQYLAETDEMVNKKVAACLDNGLTPIICVGESLEQRQRNDSATVVHWQLNRALEGIELVDNEQLVIAYEPIWAIGTGRPIEPSDAQEILQVIRQTLIDHYPLTIVNNNIRLIYGGSVEPDNCADFSAVDYLAGFLVGGASLKMELFNQIVKLSFS